jgi:hypothetical protein
MPLRARVWRMSNGTVSAADRLVGARRETPGRRDGHTAIPQRIPFPS